MIRTCVAALLNYDHPQAGQLEALSALHQETTLVDYMVTHRLHGNARAREQFVDTVGEKQPDWVWMQLQDTEVISAGALEEARHRSPETTFVHWTGDARPTVSDYLSSICRSSDLTLTSCRGHVPMYLAAGAPRAEYLQIGLDWNEDVLHHPAWEPPYRVPDVVFCGNHYGGVFPGTSDRENLVRALTRAKIDVGVVGRKGWPKDIPLVGTCSVKQQGQIYRRAKVALSINHYNNIEQYYSDRQLIAMASGTPVVCHYVPGLEREFVSGEHLLWYRTVDEGVHHVRSLLAEPATRARIGRAGRSEVIRNHSWTRRMLDVFAMVEEMKSR